MKFLADHDILSSDFGIREDRKVELEVFGRLLDRNLVAGFGAKTLSTIKWKDSDNQATVHSKDNTPAFGSDPSSASSIKYPKIQDPFDKGKETSSPRRNLKSFPVALGKSIEPPFTELSKSTCKWFASRKLDGVRVISYLDFFIPSEGSSPTLERCEFYSRTGKIFTSLGKVQEQLRRLGGYPRLRGLLDAGNNFGLGTSGGQVKRLVLDGEVCVMRERKGQEQESNHRPDDGTGAGAIWSDHNLEEDFASTVSEIRRMEPYTIDHPVYFIFDILPYNLFEAAKGSSTFGQRVEEIRNLGEWLSQHKPHEKILRPLAQWEIEDYSEIDGMVARAAEEGWEGLVMRADKPYKGSRS
jgi:DNA ligase-1